MKKVLIIDDNPDIQEAVKDLLVLSGYQVETIPDAISVLDAAQQFRPHIILLDFLLGNSDGKQIGKILKSSPETQHIPIIMISAYPNAHHHAIEAGANDFLAKPFEMNELLEKVSKNIL